METIASVSRLPAKPAVYAMYGGRAGHRYAAYVGIADNLRQRINQHLVRRDSSITTGVAAVSLNPDLVTEVDWWEHRDFTEPLKLHAAEIAAFDALNPALRSRGNVQRLAERLLDDLEFVDEMRGLFVGPPTGRLVRPSLPDAFEQLADLERRAQALEQRVTRIEGLLDR